MDWETAWMRFFRAQERRLPARGGRILVLYLSLVLRFLQRRQGAAPGVVQAGMLPALFREVPGYRIKDAAFALDAAVPWGVLTNDPALFAECDALFQAMHRAGCATAEWLRAQVAQVFCGEDDLPGATPAGVRALVAALAARRQTCQIVDLCCGGYSLGLEVWAALGSPASVACVGLEQDALLCAVARLVLFLCGVTEASVFERSVTEPFPADLARASRPRLFLADLPQTGSKTVEAPPEGRFVPLPQGRRLYADWFVLREVLSCMEAGDRAFLLVTKGATVRGNERALREALLEADCLDAVFRLPAGLYPGNRRPMELLVLEKERPVDRRGRVLCCDLSGQPLLDGALPSERLAKLAEDFDRFVPTAGLSRCVGADEIRARSFAFEPRLYLADPALLTGEVRLGDVAQVIRGLQNAGAPSPNGTRYLLNVRDLQDGGISFAQADRIALLRPEWEEKYRIREDDILLTCKGAALKIAIVPPAPPPAYICGNLTILRPLAGAYPAYLLYEYLRSKKGREALGLIQTGTTVRVLPSRQLEQLSLPSCPSDAAALGDSLKLAALRYAADSAALKRTYDEKRAALLDPFFAFGR